MPCARTGLPETYDHISLVTFVKSQTTYLARIVHILVYGRVCESGALTSAGRDHGLGRKGGSPVVDCGLCIFERMDGSAVCHLRIQCGGRRGRCYGATRDWKCGCCAVGVDLGRHSERVLMLLDHCTRTLSYTIAMSSSTAAFHSRPNLSPSAKSVTCSIQARSVHPRKFGIPPLPPFTTIIISVMSLHHFDSLRIRNRPWYNKFHTRRP